MAVQRTWCIVWVLVLFFFLSKVCKITELQVKEILLYPSEVSKTSLIFKEVIFAFDCTCVIKGTQKNLFPLLRERRFIYLFIYLNLFIYLFLAVLGLCFCARAFSSCGEGGPLFITVRGPLTVSASLVAEHRLQTRRLSSCGSRAQLLRGMWDLPRPGLNPCHLYWQADSQPLRHQGSPKKVYS